MQTAPDFFLTAAGEFKPLSDPRSCWITRHMRDSLGGSHLVVNIWPIVPLGDVPPKSDLSQVVLSPRHAHTSIAPVTNWPTHVYVSKILDESMLRGDSLELRQLGLIAWGRIHPTLEAAEQDVELHKPNVTTGVRSPERINVGVIRFVGEQDGLPERELKSKVAAICEADERVWKAYLARADSGPNTPVRIVLCLRTVMGDDDDLARKIGSVFSAQFRKAEALDILFVDNEQETKVKCVCNPFYVRTVQRRT